MAQPGDVIFRPAAERLTDRARRRFGQPVMTLAQDAVTYFDGQRHHTWRLPHQASDHPCLDHVLVAGVRFPVSMTVANYTVVFYAASGELLARVNARRRINLEEYAATLGDDQLEALKHWGVDVVHERYADGPRLYRAHPELLSSRASRLYFTHPVPWMFLGIFLIAAVYNLVLLSRGYYS